MSLQDRKLVPITQDSKLFDIFCIEFKEFINLFMRQPETDKIRLQSVYGDNLNIYSVIKVFNDSIHDKFIPQSLYNYFKGYTSYIINTILPYWHYCITNKITYIPQGERDWKRRMEHPSYRGIYDMYSKMVFNVPKFNVFKHPNVTVGAKYKQLHPELFK